MRSLGLFETKNRLSELCEQVATTGEPLVITRRGRALVRIVPNEDSSESGVWSSVAEGVARFGPLDDGLELPKREAADRRPDPLG